MVTPTSPVQELFPGASRRLGAFVIDLMVYWSVFWVVRIFVPMPRIALMSRYTPTEHHHYWLLWTVPCAFAVIYSIILHGSFLRGTLGKSLFNIAVVNSDGSTIGYGKATLRVLVMVVYAYLIFGLGPTVALGVQSYDLGPVFEYIPVILLALSFMIVPYLLLIRRGIYQQSLHHRLLNIYLVRRNKIATFAALPKA